MAGIYGDSAEDKHYENKVLEHTDGIESCPVCGEVIHTFYTCEDTGKETCEDCREGEK